MLARVHTEATLLAGARFSWDHLGKTSICIRFHRDSTWELGRFGSMASLHPLARPLGLPDVPPLDLARGRLCTQLTL